MEALLGPGPQRTTQSLSSVEDPYSFFLPDTSKTTRILGEKYLCVAERLLIPSKEKGDRKNTCDSFHLWPVPAFTLIAPSQIATMDTTLEIEIAERIHQLPRADRILIHVMKWVSHLKDWGEKVNFT